MKQFLNVLYRRILYKIPLKFLLILLAVFAVFIASVKAENVSNLITYIGDDITETISPGNYSTVIELNNSSDYGTYCIYIEEVSGADHLAFGFGNSLSYNASLGYHIYHWSNVNACLYSDFRYIFLYNPMSSNITIKYRLYKLNALLNTQVPVLSSLQCQTEYNLIPISSVDQNYCTTNNLCPTCQVCPAGSGSISTLYINDILHVGSPFIYMNIPEEIGRDYAYTQGGTNMFIDVDGYNVDYDKISDILEVQNYKPTSDDFTQVVSNLTPYVKILVFVLFVFIIWKWIKGGFKSKLK